MRKPRKNYTPIEKVAILFKAWISSTRASRRTSTPQFGSHED
jgi:hypothetical protein